MPLRTATRTAELRRFRLHGSERLESRQLLAADLVGHWVASDLGGGAGEPDVISEWTERVNGVTAVASGSPQLVPGELGGRAAVRFDALDGSDLFRVPAAESPLAGADDFSLAVVFATDSTALAGTTNRWFLNTGIVDANQGGFTADWGLVINGVGQLGGGTGQPIRSIYSTASGLNDGQPHVAIFTRSGQTLTLTVDSGPPDTLSGASSRTRSAIDVVIGALQNENNPFTGLIGEVRLYGDDLDQAETEALAAELAALYSNTAPVSADDQYFVAEETPLDVSAGQGVLANDQDADGDPLTAELVDGPLHGSLELRADGSFLYQPDPDYFGSDQFVYWALDPQRSEPATVVIQVTPVFDAAKALPNDYLVDAGRKLWVEAGEGVLADDLNPDGGPLTARLVNPPTAGKLELSPDGAFAYDPAGFSGTTSFVYAVVDAGGRQNSATVRLRVDARPVAVDDQYSVAEDGVLNPAAADGVLRNDRDAEADPLSVALGLSPRHGAVQLESDGSFRYQPHPDYHGPDRFTYRLDDGDQLSAWAVVTIDVTPTADPPRPVDDTYLTGGDTTLVVSTEEGVLADDLDVDDELAVLTARLVSGPQHGTLNLAADGSFRYTPEGSFLGTDRFEYVASDGASESAIAAVQIFVGTPPVQINEFVAANTASLTTRVRATAAEPFAGTPDSPDWLEVVNHLAVPFDLSGYRLTQGQPDDPGWEIPAGTMIPAGGHVVFLASGLDLRDPALDEQGWLHTDFRLGAEGERLALAAPDGTVIHEFAPAYPPQRPDIAYGLDAGGTPQYLTTPTPGAANASDVVQIVREVGFSVAGGFHTAPLQLTLASDTPGATIRFTTDGSAPTADRGEPYLGPLEISTTTVVRAAAFLDGALPSRVTTHSYLFLADIIQQPEQPDGFPTTWGNGRVPDWGMDPRIATDPTSPHFQPQLVEALQALPSLSLVTDNQHLFSDSTGIFALGHTLNQGLEWERPVSVEILTPEGRREIQADAGLRLQGATARNPDRPKHNMRLLFRETYGPKRLEYPLFPNSDVERFDSIVLRAGNGDGWFLPGGNGGAQYVRDQWHRATHAAMGRVPDAQAYAHLYINGLYWGLFHLFDRPAAAFLAEHYGGDEEDYDAFQHGGQVMDGDRQAWEQVVALADAGTETPEQLAAIEQFLDLSGLADYLLLRWYSGDEEFDNNNWSAGRKREAGAPVLFFSWDAESSFRSVDSDRTGRHNRGAPTGLHGRLLANPEYRMVFADQIHRHFFNGGVFTPEVAANQWRALADQIELALWAEAARFGDNQRAEPLTPAVEWAAERDRLLNAFFPQRTEIALGHFRDAGLYPLVEAPRFHQHGGRVTPGFELSLTAPEGRLYYTTDGTDPRLPGGELSPLAVRAREGETVALSADTTVKARVLQDGTWSALNEAEFTVRERAADAATLRVSELHYHPRDPDPAAGELGSDDDQFEFVELTNIGDVPLDLTGVRLAGAVRFTFAAQTLAPGGSVVVVNDSQAFESRYGVDVPLAAGSDGPEYAGQFSNNREELQVLAADGSMIQQFSYDDDWHPASDGRGSSLVVVDLAAEPNAWSSSTNWRPSSVSDGTPGEPELPGDTNRDQQRDAADIDLLWARVRGRSGRAFDDLNRDGNVNAGDVEELVFGLLGTTYGDTNLDGVVDVAHDGQTVLAALGRDQPAGWLQGDFDGDRRVTASGDGARLLAGLAADLTSGANTAVWDVVFSTPFLQPRRSTWE